jgi:outer membrane biosynthesis protein TonB
MPIPEHSPLGPDFEKQLKAALDRVRPPSPLLSSARYRSAPAGRLGARWRLAPALVIAIGAAGVALTAVAATGSPNPVVWTERAGSVIESVSHLPGASPKATQSPRPEPSHGTSPGHGTGPAHSTPSNGHKSEPQPSPEPNEPPEDSPRPEPSPTPDEHPEPSPTPDHSGDGKPTPSPGPSPTPDHGGDHGSD